MNAVLLYQRCHLQMALIQILYLMMTKKKKTHKKWKRKRLTKETSYLKSNEREISHQKYTVAASYSYKN